MRTKRKIVNLYEDKNIYSIKHVFSISTEDDLNELWDYLTKADNTAHHLIHIFTTQFYNFTLYYITTKDADFFEIILEESDDFFYFTIWNQKTSLLFKKYIERESSNFKYADNKITIKLIKKAYKKKQQKIDKRNEKREQYLIKSAHETPTQIEPCKFIEDDDLHELIRLSEDLQEFMYQAKKVGLNKTLFISFRSTLSMFCFTLGYYEKLSPITNTITEFSNLLYKNREKLTGLNAIELELIHGFILNIDRWLHTLFVTGVANIYFMDNSMKSDYNTISQIILPQENSFEEFDLDNIFSF